MSLTQSPVAVQRSDSYRSAAQFVTRAREKSPEVVERKSPRADLQASVSFCFIAFVRFLVALALVRSRGGNFNLTLT